MSELYDGDDPHPSIAESTVTIIGVGLIGGSLGRALDGRCARRIGVVRDGDADTERTALALEVVDEVLPFAEAVAAADIVVLCVPVGEILRLLPSVAAAARPGTLVTDVGSTKRDVVHAMFAQRASGATFVGGHPMAGGTVHGLSAVDARLFDGARWVLCATTEDPVEDTAVARAAALAEAMGADPIIVDAAEHDRALALVSHLPRVVASSLVDLLERRSPDEPLAGILAARGWAGATRLAHGDDTMWADTLGSNRLELLEVIEELRTQLADVAHRIEATA